MSTMPPPSSRVVRSVTPRALSMSVEEFDAWVTEESHAEFIDGKVFLMSPVGRKHADLQTWLISVLSIFVQQRNLGSVRGPEFQMRFPTKRFEPDLLFVSQTRAHQTKETFLDGPADMVLEIVSPESASRDWRDKMDAYEEGGVAEYWVVDPAEERLECYVLDDGDYRSTEAVNGKLHSTTIAGFYLRAEWLWATAAPDVLAVLEELGVLRRA